MLRTPMAQDCLSPITDTDTAGASLPVARLVSGESSQASACASYRQFKVDAASARRVAGNKDYEFTDHLGNVRATVTDRRLPAFDNGTIVDFRTEVDQWGDYYAFG